MTERILVVWVATALAACAHRSASGGASSPDRTVTSIQRVDTAQPDARAALQRATRVAGEVDTIIVRPDTLVLHVDQALMPWGAIQIEARNAAGSRVAGFAPFMKVEDRSIVEFTGASFIGRRVGQTRLEITPMTLDDTVRARAPRAFVILRVEP